MATLFSQFLHQQDTKCSNKIHSSFTIQTYDYLHKSTWKWQKQRGSGRQLKACGLL